MLTKRLQNQELSRAPYGKFDAMKRTKSFRTKPATDERENDNFALKVCILHNEFTETRFDTNQNNNNQRAETDDQLLPSITGFLYCDTSFNSIRPDQHVFRLILR